MKYIKKFESVDAPQIGDYVVCQDGLSPSSDNDNLLNDFMSNNIGVIVMYDPKSSYGYEIEYNNIPDNAMEYFSNNYILVSKSEIKFWSKNKEDVEAYLSGKKYNL